MQLVLRLCCCRSKKDDDEAVSSRTTDLVVTGLIPRAPYITMGVCIILLKVSIFMMWV